MTPKEKKFREGLKGGGSGVNDSRQAKAGFSGIAVQCPCCEYWFQPTQSDVHKHLIRRVSSVLKRRMQRAIRRWLELNWGTKLDKHKLDSPHLGKIYVSGISKGMNNIFQTTTDHAHIIFGINDSPMSGDNYVCIPAGEFFTVMRRLMDGSKEFARRIGLEWASSAKGEGLEVVRRSEPDDPDGIPGVAVDDFTIRIA